MDELTDQDDWSFVIKGHALLEAALAQLLAAKADQRLFNHFRRLPFAGSRNSKVGVASDLELIDSHLNQFLVTLSKLRNQLAHDVRQARFKFEDYAKSLGAKEFRVVAEAFGNVFEELRGREAREAREALARFNLRFAVQFAVLVALAQLHFAAFPEDLAKLSDEWDDANVAKVALVALIALAIVAAQKRKDEGEAPST